MAASFLSAFAKYRSSVIRNGADTIDRDCAEASHSSKTRRWQRLHFSELGKAFSRGFWAAGVEGTPHPNRIVTRTLTIVAKMGRANDARSFIPLCISLFL
jgi:hypothetical protein